MQIIVDKLAITYEISGKGRPILLLHGWGDDHSTFNELAETLSHKYQVISVDLPGFGGSQLPQTAWGLQEYSHFLSHFLSKLEIRPYALVGHSNGGAIAIRAVGSELIDCQKLILLASSGVRKKATPRKSLYKIAAWLGKFLAAPLPVKQRRKLRERLYAAAGSDYLVSPQMSDTFKRIVSEDIQETAKNITTPTMLIYGARDEETPVSFGELLARKIANSQLEIIENAGHHLHHDAAVQVIDNIVTFLQA